MPFFLKISTSPSRNRLWRSLIRLLLVSTVYIRSSKQRELFAVFAPNSPAILGPHGAAGVAGPRCPPWAANPTARPTIRTPTTIPERPERVSINCFFIDLLVMLRLVCRQNNASICCCEVPRSRRSCAARLQTPFRQAVRATKIYNSRPPVHNGRCNAVEILVFPSGDFYLLVSHRSASPAWPLGDHQDYGEF